MRNQIWLQEVRKANIYASKTNDIWMRAARQIIHIKQYAPEEKRVTGITIHTFDDNFRLIERVDAGSGVFLKTAGGSSTMPLNRFLKLMAVSTKSS